jgi:hypothetical protein
MSKKNVYGRILFSSQIMDEKEVLDRPRWRRQSKSKFHFMGFGCWTQILAPGGDALITRVKTEKYYNGAPGIDCNGNLTCRVPEDMKCMIIRYNHTT